MIQFDEHIFQMGWNRQPVSHCHLWRCRSVVIIAALYNPNNPQGSRVFWPWMGTWMPTGSRLAPRRMKRWGTRNPPTKKSWVKDKPNVEGAPFCSFSSILFHLWCSSFLLTKHIYIACSIHAISTGGSRGCGAAWLWRCELLDWGGQRMFNHQTNPWEWTYHQDCKELESEFLPGMWPFWPHLWKEKHKIAAAKSDCCDQTT